VSFEFKYRIRLLVVRSYALDYPVLEDDMFRGNTNEVFWEDGDIDAGT